MKIKEAIIVEGIYDKITLDSICDALIVPTYGFSIFTDDERLSYIRTLAEKTGIIVLMDSDAAGFKIRTFLKERIKTGKIIDAYIPACKGKEKRKTRPSAEGTLGVEGLDKDTLVSILSSVTEATEKKSAEISGADFYEDGLLGSENSVTLRGKLSEKLSLPQKLSTKALLKAVNALLTYEEYKALIKNLNN